MIVGITAIIMVTSTNTNIKIEWRFGAILMLLVLVSCSSNQGMDQKKMATLHISPHITTVSKLSKIPALVIMATMDGKI